jgi:[protein-PII] uridylyltransferase
MIKLSPDHALHMMPLPHTQDWQTLQLHVTAHIKPWLEAQRQQIRNRFFIQRNPDYTLKSLTDLTDHILQYLVDCACHHLTITQAPLAIIALGGYGRNHLFPYSDIDILCLYTPQQHEHAAQVSSFILHVMWDLGFQVGHSIRTIAESYEAAKHDHTILTAMLDARLVAGNRPLHHLLNTQVVQRLKAEQHMGQFINAKLKERDKRHERGGDSRYILEPNIKENKGALRDLHTLFWIAHYAYQITRIHDLIAQGKITENEYRSYRRARHFLWIVRIYLHYFANRPEERLTFDMQRRIAEAMEYRGKNTNQSVERFMKRYFQVARDIGSLTGLFCATLEEEQKRNPRTFIYDHIDKKHIFEDFLWQNGRLHLHSQQQITTSPHIMIKFFHTSCIEHIALHPRALQWISRSLHLLTKEVRNDPKVLRWFLEILTHANRGLSTLRTMNDTGVLGKLIPEFAHIVGQMQFDMYHIYTVDEHTLTAIGILHAIERGEMKQDLPLSTRTMPQIKAKHVLYIAMFCHDIAKGRGGDHEAKGEPIAKRLAKSCGCTPAEIELAGWLVRNQSLMTNIIFKRDLHDPATLHYFSKEVQSLEKLRLLLVLSAADIKAVGPKVWNSWKGGLLRDLFHMCEDFITTGNTDTRRNTIHLLRSALEETLPDWSQNERESYLWRGHNAYFNSRDAEKHATVARLLRTAEHAKLSVITHIYNEPFLDFTVLTVCSPDRKGLLADVAAAISLAGQNIINASIFTLKDGWGVQTWHIQTPTSRAIDESSYRHVLKCVEDMVEGRTHYSLLDKQQRPSLHRETFHVPTHVYIENTASSSHTIIEITAADRIGLLHTICRTLQLEALNISSAHINTYGEKAVDVFYVRDSYGMKVLHPQKLEHIRNALTYAISPTAQLSTFNYII